MLRADRAHLQAPSTGSAWGCPAYSTGQRAVHAKRIAGPRCRFVDPAEGDLKCKGMKYLDFL